MTAVRTLRGLALACHPGPCLAVTTVAVLLAATAGLDAAACVRVGAAFLVGQLSIGWSNDAIDASRDAVAGRSDKPIATGLVSRDVVAVSAGVAFALCVPLSLAMGVLAGPLHLVAVASAWTYNAWLKRTVASWLPYSVSFGLLPTIICVALPGRPGPPAWAVAAGALLGVGAHFANVLPDLAADRATAVNGLPQRLASRAGAGAVRIAAFLLLGTASVLVVFGPPGRVGAAALVGLGGVVVLAVVGLAGGGRRSFYCVMGVALVDVVMLVARGGALH